MNNPLFTGCPVCAGTGHASFLRSNAWVNPKLPARNGPLDDDGSPMCCELDNYELKRSLRIEYKRRSDQIPVGQYKHFRSELESVRADWTKFLVLILDEGQTQLTDRVSWGFRTSKAPQELKGWTSLQTTTIGQLANRISMWLWGPA